MRRLTVDEPSNNMESIWNIVFVKDNDVWLKGLGEDNEDINLVDYCKKEFKKQRGYELEGDISTEDFGDYMEDEDLLSNFYWTCVGFAEVRQQLKKYYDRDLC